MKDMTPQEKVDSLVESGMCRGQNHAAHFLHDMGEIDMVEHARLLTEDERRRVYDYQEEGEGLQASRTVTDPGVHRHGE